MTTTTLPPHLQSAACYVCGGTKHSHQPGEPNRQHTYWPNSEAWAEAAALDKRAANPDAAAAYVAQHRPY